MKISCSTTFTTIPESSIYCLSNPWKPSSSLKSTGKRTSKILLFGSRNLSLRLSPRRSNSLSPNRFRPLCCFNAKDESGGDFQQKGNGGGWPILRRWEVPWGWQTVSLTSLACGLSVIVTGLVESAAIPYLGIRIEELSLDEKAEILLLNQGIATVAVLGIIYSIANTFQPLPDDIYRYDIRDPLNLQKGWLLWAGVGLVGALASIAVTGAVLSSFNGGSTQRETDALVRLLPLVGSSSISTACLVGITGVLAPVLEETVFRGFFMVSLTKWIPTPVAVLISAAVFALAHFTPGEFPQLFVLGNVDQLQVLLKLWNCSGIFLCSNSQPPDPHHHPCFVELGRHFASYLSYAPRLRYQGVVADNMTQGRLLFKITICASDHRLHTIALLLLASNPLIEQ